MCMCIHVQCMYVLHFEVVKQMKYNLLYLSLKTEEHQSTVNLKALVFFQYLTCIGVHMCMYMYVHVYTPVMCIIMHVLSTYIQLVRLTCTGVRGLW